VVANEDANDSASTAFLYGGFEFVTGFRVRVLIF